MELPKGRRREERRAADAEQLAWPGRLLFSSPSDSTACHAGPTQAVLCLVLIGSLGFGFGLAGSSGQLGRPPSFTFAHFASGLPLGNIKIQKPQQSYTLSLSLRVNQVVFDSDTIFKA
jgi:hypothetical protein